MGRKSEVKVVSSRTETAYKARQAGKAAQHAKAQGSSCGVNAGVVQLEFAFLSGETSKPCASETGSGIIRDGGIEAGGVSRGHSVCLAAHISGGLKSLSARGHGLISKSGGNSSLAGECG